MSNKRYVIALSLLIVFTAFFSVSKAINVVALSRTGTQASLAAVAAATSADSQAVQAAQAGDSVTSLTGQINALNTSLINTNAAFQKLADKDKAASDKLLVNLSAQRKILMKQLMKTSPGFFNLFAMKSSQRSALSKDVQKNIEQGTSVTGKIVTIHHDPPEGQGDDYFTYQVVASSASYDFYPSSDVTIPSGTTVKVNGYVLDSQLSANTDQSPVQIVKQVGKSDTGLAPSSVGDQKTLVLLLSDTPTSTVPFDTTTAHDLVFNGGMQKFYNEQSYGQVSFSGDVYGWIVYPQEATSCTFIDPTTLGTIVNTYNINLSDYTRIVYLAKDAGGGCSGVGTWSHIVNGQTYNFSESYIGLIRYNYPSDWGTMPFSWTSLDYVLSHELGHALGTMHANAWDCGDQIDSGNCSHIEYGNAFDTMGTGNLSLDFNAFYKDYLGWISPSRIISITKSGTYTVNPLELQSGIAAAKISILGSTTTPFYIEFRQPIGFDSNLANNFNSTQTSPTSIKNTQGIFVNRIITNQGYPFPRLLDMHPTNLDFHDDIVEQATLDMAPGSSTPQVFNDPADGIVIGPITQFSTSSVTFTVSLSTPTCVRQQPIFNAFDSSYGAGAQLDINYYPVASGGTKEIILPIINPDYFGCGASSFHVSVVLPEGWTSNTQDTTLQPGQDGNDYLSINPVGAAGTYPIEIDLTNAQSGMKAVYQGKLTVSTPVTITSVNPSFGLPGTTVTIIGTSFGSWNNEVGISGVFGYTNNNNFLESTNNGTQIVYTIPTSITTCSNSCVSTSTPFGQYTLAVQANGSGATTNFRVGGPYTGPTVSIQPTPVPSLIMQYNSAQKESALVSTYQVNVSAGSDDQEISKNSAFQTYLTTSSSGSSSGNAITVGGNTQYAEPAGVTDNGNGFYVIPAGTTATFLVTTTYNPQIMFAGKYYSVLPQVMLGDYSNSTWIPITANSQSNPVVVIGEQSPYIDSNSGSVVSGTQLTIYGVRFSTTAADTVTLSQEVTDGTAGISKGFLVKSADGTVLQFAPDVPAGNYFIQVIDPVTGGSNSGFVTITPPLPTVTITASPNPVPYNTAPMIHWQSTNASSCSASYSDFTTANSVSGSTLTGQNLGIVQTTTATYPIVCNGLPGTPAGTVATAQVVVPVIPPSTSASGNPILPQFSLSPISGSAGSTVTAWGSNFGASATVLFNGTNIHAVYVPVNTKAGLPASLTFTVPQNLPAGSYGVVVSNAGATSNSVTFTLTQGSAATPTSTTPPPPVTPAVSSPVAQPTSSISIGSPATNSLVLGTNYPLSITISNATPNSPVLMYVERPDGSYIYNGTGYFSLKTDTNGNFTYNGTLPLTIQGEQGTYTAWLSVNGVQLPQVHYSVTGDQQAQQTQTTTQSSAPSGSVGAVNNSQNNPTAQGLIYVYWPSQGSGYTYTVSASPSYSGSVETTTGTGINMGCYAGGCFNGGGAFPTNGPYTFTVTATNSSGQTTTVGTSAPEYVTGTSATSASTQTSAVLNALSHLFQSFFGLL